MRSTIISIILFCLLSGGVVWNAIFVHNVSVSLTEYAEELSSPDIGKLCALESYWNEQRVGLGISISGVFLDGMEKTILSMRSAYETGDLVEYQKNLYIFHQYAKTIGKAERISFESIL